MIKRWLRKAKTRIPFIGPMRKGVYFLEKRFRFLLFSTSKAEVRSVLALLRPVGVGVRLIRIGPKGDGGYVLPDDLQGIAGCVSPGVSTMSDFEREIADRGIPVILADASVERPLVNHPLFDFRKQFVGPLEQGDFVTLQSLAEALPQGDLLLQMDIEGYEYPVIAAQSRSDLARYRIIVVEFHAVHRMLTAGRIASLRNALEKLLQDFDVVHIHANNFARSFYIRGIDVPKVLEVTFLRRDRRKGAPTALKSLACSFDCPNTSTKADLDQEWLLRV